MAAASWAHRQRECSEGRALALTPDDGTAKPRTNDDPERPGGLKPERTAVGVP